MPPPIPKNDLDRILAWINEFVPPVDAGLSPAALEAQTRNTASFNVLDVPSAPQGRRQDFDDRTVIRLVTELWREAMIGSGISQESDIANNLFLYIARGINEDGRASGGEILPEDIPGATQLELNAFDIFRQREIDVDSFPSSGVSGHKLPLKGMMKGALARGLLDAGRIPQEVFDRLRDPIIGGGGAFSPVEREAAAVQRTLERDFNELLDASRKAPGAGTAGLRQAFVNVLTSETPGQIASGESVFKFETPGEISGERIDEFLKDNNSFVTDIINTLNPDFNPKTTVDKDETATLSQGHVREKARIKSEFDDLVSSGMDEADAAARIIQGLDALTANDFQQIIQGVGQELQLQKFSTPEGKIKALKDFAFNEGLDISPNAITPEALAEVQRRIPNTGITPDVAEAIRGIIPVLQQQKSNQDFAAQKPEARQAQIGGQLGFGAQTFGTQKGGFAFQTPFEIAQQKALGASQANAAAVIDRQLQQAFAQDPNLNIDETIAGFRTPGQDFSAPSGTLQTQDRGRFVGSPSQGFTQGDDQVQGVLDIPGRIAQIRAEQPSIEGLLPFQVHGSLSEQQQFGAIPPNPPTFGGVLPPIAGGFVRPASLGDKLLARAQRLDESRGLGGGANLIFDRKRLLQNLSDTAGGDTDLFKFLQRKINDPGLIRNFQDVSNRATGRRNEGGRLFSQFIGQRLRGFKAEFENSPATLNRRRRNLSRGSGQATFSVFGNRRF